MPSASALKIELDKQGRLHIKGALDLQHFSQAEQDLKQATSTHVQALDLSGLTRLDTAGAWLIEKIAGSEVRLEHVSPPHQALLELIRRAKIGSSPVARSVSSWHNLIVRLGKATVRAWHGTYSFISFLGRACMELGKAIRHARVRPRDISHYIETIGIDALPIISLIAFVISIVIAYQGQAQLKPLGADQYTVNLIAISVLREMGVLLTAIMIAGRSGSAFTAEIGTMQVREEVDALRSIGFKPFELLVLPRLLALLIALPLLTMVADLMGLFGGALVTFSIIDISIPEYLERARHAATWQDFFVGMIKAPVFALVIALVGCMHGLKVSGSADSVGKETTASVVEAIFLVLVLDGFFSIYFDKVGL